LLGTLPKGEISGEREENREGASFGLLLSFEDRVADAGEEKKATILF